MVAVPDADRGELGRPAGLVLQVGVDVHRILRVAPAERHQAVVTGPARLVSVVVEVGEVADHVAVLVAERPEGQLRPHVGELVVVELLAAGDRVRRCQRPRVRPEPFAPVVDVGLGVEDVQRVDEAAAVAAERAEVEARRHQVVERLDDELPRPRAVGDRRVRVVRAVVGGGVVRRDHVRVGQLAVGDLEEVVAYGAVVAEAAVADEVAVVVDLGLRDRGRDVRELDQQAEPDIRPHGRGRQRGRPQRG